MVVVVAAATEVARQPEAVVAGDNTSAADAGIVIAEELVVDIEMVVVAVVAAADVETIADAVAGIEKDPLEAGQLMVQVASFVQTLKFGGERKESVAQNYFMPLAR